MAVHFSPADRTYMRHFFIGIAVLGLATVIEIVIATFVFASLPKNTDPQAVQQASERIAPVAAVYSGSSGRAAMKKANASGAGAAPASAAAAAAPSGPYSYDAAKGKSLFDGTCAACHQATGEGVAGAFPPLKGNPAVNDADPKSQIETILFGRHGTVIQGHTYPGAMPPFGSQFSDLQVADIANYERSSWGNHGKQVNPKDVAAIRASGK
ncbi:MAG: c-type cytochrome [Rhodanobacteraceae bacterium]